MRVRLVKWAVVVILYAAEVRHFTSFSHLHINAKSLSIACSYLLTTYAGDFFSHSSLSSCLSSPSLCLVVSSIFSGEMYCLRLYKRLCIVLSQFLLACVTFYTWWEQKIPDRRTLKYKLGLIKLRVYFYRFRHNFWRIFYLIVIYDGTLNERSNNLTSFWVCALCVIFGFSWYPLVPASAIILPRKCMYHLQVCCCDAHCLRYFG